MTHALSSSSLQPATIPQGVVDMNRVLEVSCAEEVTGNQFSLAITAPDRVTFIKATCKEEAKWWMDVLSVFPCTLKVMQCLPVSPTILFLHYILYLTPVTDENSAHPMAISWFLYLKPAYSDKMKGDKSNA